MKTPLVCTIESQEEKAVGVALYTLPLQTPKVISFLIEVGREKHDLDEDWLVW